MAIDDNARANPSKTATVIKLLSRVRGATLGEMTAATSWQAHSVRAYLSGLRKKGHVLIRESRKSGESAYRLLENARVEPATDAAPSTVGTPALSGHPVADAVSAALAS